MAYKEIIKKSINANNGQLTYIQPGSTPDPNEANYLATRNAAAANQGLTPTSHVVGQWDYYVPSFWEHKYHVYRSTLQFDTSIIPEGAPIEYATLEIMGNEDKSNVDFDIVITNGQPDYPHTPVIASDYFHENYEGDGGSLNTAGFLLAAFNSIPLNATGWEWIKKGSGAITKLMLRSSRDISSTMPTSSANDERITFLSIDVTTKIPKLTIRWTLSIPSPTTLDPTGVEGTGATFKGEMPSSGYWLNKYGFEYKKEIDGNIIENIVGGGVGGVEGEFEKVKTGLDPDAIYYYRAFGENDAGRGVGAWKWFKINYPEILNIKATRSAGHLYLYGEIVDLLGNLIVERGFEYKVQDSEPGEEDTGTEVKETDEEGFGEGEFHLSSWDTFNDLYCAEENKIWWFRTYLKDDEDNKYIAEKWMKNVPTMTTFECTEAGAQEAKGNGELIDIGANIVTKRGFRIIKEYSGDLFGAWTYRADGFIGELEIQEEYAPNGVLIGFKWVGNLYRDSFDQNPSGYNLGIYNKVLGGGFSEEGFGMYLKPNDNYKIVAIGENQLGIGFGLEVGLETGQMIVPNEDDENVSEISAEKTITLGVIPDGATVTRIGIRLGRTMGCNEIHVFEDGEWGSYESLTFYITGFVPGDSYYKIPYIVVNYGDYEEEILAIPDYRNPERLEEWLEDYPIETFPEVDDEDLDETITDASVGDISYRTIIREIKCSKIGDQSFIDKYGRRRSKTINNHLIQTRSNCKTIVDDYIEKFQILKLKLAVDYDIPIPFEREDCILLGDGKEKYREDGQGLIVCKADGEGEVLQEDFILAKIRKIDGRYISGKETILNLELEV